MRGAHRREKARDGSPVGLIGVIADLGEFGEEQLVEITAICLLIDIRRIGNRGVTHVPVERVVVRGVDTAHDSLDILRREVGMLHGG